MKNYSLFELNQEITAVLDAHLEPSYWVIAEISQVQVNQKGHCYLEVVEKEGNSIKAKMRATIWSYTYRNLITWFENMTRQSLKPGMEILFNAVVQYHEVYGISLNIRDIDANFTLGERARKRTETIERLKEDGVFDMNRQLELPMVPQKIAVISAATAAGYGDFNEQLHNNQHSYFIKTVLFNAIMQGKEAEASIVNALHKIYAQINEFDLVAVIRGGGSSTDLDCFDSYELCSHIAQFPIPVVTGIGHDRDETICDLVSHTNLKTPTAVSEFIISGVKVFEDKVDAYLSELYHHLNQKIASESIQLEKLVSKLHRTFSDNLRIQKNHLEKFNFSLQHHSKKLLESQAGILILAEKQLKNKSPKLIVGETQKIRSLEKYFEVINPENVLRRGFTLTKVNGTSLSKYKNEIIKGDEVETITHEFTLKSEVKEPINKPTRNDKGKI